MQIIESQPFIKFRECTLSDPWGLYYNKPRLKDEHRQRYCIELWPVSQLTTYVDMVQAFGYNSIQISDLWENYKMGKLDDPAVWRGKVLAVLKYAREKGMRTSLFVWGNSPYDYRDGSVHRRTNWHTSEGRELLEQYYDYQAQYAPHVDHVVTHWGDPGGCLEDPNTIETAQELHNIIMDRFKKGNPQIQASFSLWALHSDVYGKWKGYEDESTILNSGILPEDTMLAMHARYQDKQAKAIHDAGRRAGVWCWYLADQEIRPSLHVHHKRIGEYFNSLPDRAGKLLEWHSMESNSHLLNTWNLYVAAQLMIDPKQNADTLLAEYAGKVFGEALREPVVNALEAIATTRCLKDYDYASMDMIADALPDVPAFFIAKEDDNPDWDLAKLFPALEGLENAALPQSHRPAFPMIITPDDLLNEIRIHLKSIIGFACFRKAVKQGVGDLPAIPEPDESITQIEHNFYQAEMKRLNDAN